MVKVLIKSFDELEQTIVIKDSDDIHIHISYFIFHIHISYFYYLVLSLLLIINISTTLIIYMLILYTNLGCYYSHYLLVFIEKYNLHSKLIIDIVAPSLSQYGLYFADGFDFKTTNDSFRDLDMIKQVYHAISPCVSGKMILPLLVESEPPQILSNNSLEIIRMLAERFSVDTDWLRTSLDITNCHKLVDQTIMIGRVYEYQYLTDIRSRAKMSNTAQLKSKNYGQGTDKII
eukprot:Mrub_04099.p1 GENE.Mrub_04099~~Mrub_04099.p1  ORF type:complete len:232 (+),score=55.65 Mrub_04099:284-979(+)